MKRPAGCRYAMDGKNQDVRVRWGFLHNTSTCLYVKKKTTFFYFCSFFYCVLTIYAYIFVINDAINLVSTGGQILKRRKENEKASRFSVHRFVARRMQ